MEKVQMLAVGAIKRDIIKRGNNSGMPVVKIAFQDGPGRPAGEIRKNYDDIRGGITIAVIEVHGKVAPKAWQQFAEAFEGVPVMTITDGHSPVPEFVNWVTWMPSDMMVSVGFRFNEIVADIALLDGDDACRLLAMADGKAPCYMAGFDDEEELKARDFVFENNGWRLCV